MHESEDSIRSGIEAMEICNFPCCKRTAKIKPLLKMIISVVVVVVIDNFIAGNKGSCRIWSSCFSIDSIYWTYAIVTVHKAVKESEVLL